MLLKTASRLSPTSFYADKILALCQEDVSMTQCLLVAEGSLPIAGALVSATTVNPLSSLFRGLGRLIGQAKGNWNTELLKNVMQIASKNEAKV